MPLERRSLSQERRLWHKHVGRSCGAGPLLADAKAVPFGELEPLDRELRTKRYAAFVVEPIQSEAGACLPPADYLRTAESLYRRHGTLFVLEEVQTGLHRTGPFPATLHFGVEPDMVVLPKGHERRAGAERSRTDV